MARLPTHPLLQAARPYATRFAKAYLAVASLVTAGWLLSFAYLTPDLLFNWPLGPFSVMTAIQWGVTSTITIAGSVVLFSAGVAYERYRD